MTDNSNQNLKASTPDSTSKSPQKSAEPPTKKAPEPLMKKVDIVIAGITYQIYAPIDEIDELNAAVHYINNFLLDIKKDAPNLNQENLLVLCCLNLYEKIHANDKASATSKQQNKQVEALLSKITQEAKSIL